MTSASLFASSTRLPARTAASVGISPAAPTIAAITTWTLSAVTSAASASAPLSTRVLDAQRLERGARLRRGLRIREHHHVGLELPRLLDHGLPAAVGAQHRDAKALGMQGDDRERRAPDAAGRAQDGDAARARSCDDS